MTEENGDGDKQLDRVFVEFSDEALKELITIDSAIRERVLNNVLELTVEEHRMLLEEIAELRADLTQLAPRLAKRSSPPAPAAFLLAFVAPKHSAQALLGDLEEMFQKNVDKFGERAARRMYWLEVARSFGPLVWQWIKRMGFVTLVIDYVRSKFGL